MWHYLVFGVKKNADHCCDCLAPTVNSCYEAAETVVPQIMITVSFLAAQTLELEH